jgi:hypothetical protein
MTNEFHARGVKWRCDKRVTMPPAQGAIPGPVTGRGLATVGCRCSIRSSRSSLALTWMSGSATATTPMRWRQPQLGYPAARGRQDAEWLLSRAGNLDPVGSESENCCRCGRSRAVAARRRRAALPVHARPRQCPVRRRGAPTAGHRPRGSRIVGRLYHRLPAATAHGQTAAPRPWRRRVRLPDGPTLPRMSLFLLLA